jgi:chromosome condensin MukBEF ATPase and DNA-binding subunit MukB
MANPTEMNEIHRDLGALSVEVRSLKEEMRATRDELKEVRDALLQAKGGWKTVAAIGAIAGAVVSFVATAIKIKLAPLP